MMNEFMINYRLNRKYKYSFEVIGVHDRSDGFKLVYEDGEFLICCDNVRFNLDVACDLLNELNEENIKLKKEMVLNE